jgi:arylsulfate sulfotransferase
MDLRHLLSILAVLFLLSLNSCGNGADPIDEVLEKPLNVSLNPHGRVPLGASLEIATKEPCKLTYTVEGESPLGETFPDYAKTRTISVLGLYPGQENKVSLTLTTEAGKVYEGNVSIETAPLPITFPFIEVTSLKQDKMEPGLHLVELLLANNGKFLPYSVMFDNQGAIRWFMDMSEQGQITYTTYRLKNGNWLYLDWIDLIEVDDLGKTVKKEQMWGNAGNHDVIEMTNGMLLMGGSKVDSYILVDGEKKPTRFDHVLMWDRLRNRTAKEWDLRKYFKVDRQVFPADYGMDFSTDWFHVNSVAINPQDNSLLVSGRNQGVAKIGPDDQLRWILGPHVAWGQAGFDGKGLMTTDYLLAAADKNGDYYPGEVQQGRVSAADFDWPTGQHALSVLANGNVLLFDNGLRRNFKSDPSYSRAVEFKIDEANRTVTQVWQYGKERGLEMYSPITSDVDALPNGNRLITSGNVRASGKPGHAKMVEVTYPDNEVVFEADLFFKDASGTKEKSWGQFDIVFRGERYHLITQ